MLSSEGHTPIGQLLPLFLHQLFIEQQIGLRVEDPGLRYHLNCGVADVDPLAMGSAAAFSRPWQVFTLLICPLLQGRANLNVGRVVAPAHGPTVFNNAIQAVEDTFPSYKVLAGC